MQNVESIAEFFEKDHREIDAIFEKLSFRDQKADLFLFQEFDRRLERHINWEENILFPSIGAVNPMMEQGPVRVMKMEHDAIRQSKAKASEAFLHGDMTSAKEHCDAVLQVLGQHNMKEEHILYPACDQSLDRVAVSDIFSKLKSSSD